MVRALAGECSRKSSETSYFSTHWSFYPSFPLAGTKGFFLLWVVRVGLCAACYGAPSPKSSTRLVLESSAERIGTRASTKTRDTPCRAPARNSLGMNVRRLRARRMRRRMWKERGSSGSVNRDNPDNCAYLKHWKDKVKLNWNWNDNANPKYGSGSRWGFSRDESSLPVFRETVFIRLFATRRACGLFSARLPATG